MKLAAKRKARKTRARKPRKTLKKRHRRQDATRRQSKLIRAQSVAAKGSAKRLKYIVSSMSFTFDDRRKVGSFLRAARKICKPNAAYQWTPQHKTKDGAKNKRMFGVDVPAKTLKAPATCKDVASLASKYGAVRAMDHIFDRTKKLVSLTARKRNLP
jgi:hypothetical protein